MSAVDMRAVIERAEALGCKVWEHPGRPGTGHIFCRRCGSGGDIAVDFKSWIGAPHGCLRHANRNGCADYDDAGGSAPRARQGDLGFGDRGAARDRGAPPHGR